MYEFKNIDVLTVLEDLTPLRPTRPYFPPPASNAIELSVGEFVMLRVVIEKTNGNFSAGDFYIFNSNLFHNPSDTNTPLLEKNGWLFELKNSGGLVGSARWLGNLRERNYLIDNISIVGNELSFNYCFYCTMDVASWGGARSTVNKDRFNKTIIDGDDPLNNSYSSAYTRSLSNIEICFFESDNLGGFLGGNQDYICRDPNNPTQNSFLIPCSLKWYDEKVGGESGWVNPTTKESDYLKVLEVDSGGIPNRVEINHRTFPFKSNFLDSNFEVEKNTIAFGGENQARFIISTPSSSATNTNVLTRLLREGDINEDSNFISATGGEMADIPQVQPLPTTINKFFKTPSSWSGGADLSADFILEGNAFDTSKNYRLGVLLVDTVSDKSSAHKSPVLGVGGLVGAFVNITGFLETYNNQYINSNDLVVSSFERVKLKLQVDANTWTNGGASGFADHLKSIQLISNIGTQTVILPTSSSSNYNFTTSTATGLYQINVSEVGGVYTIEAEVRAIWGGVSGQVITHTWGLNFLVPSTPTAQEIIISFPQTIRVQPEPQILPRLNTLLFLDYNLFLAGVRKSIGVVCSDDEFVVIEVRKNGVPDMNLIALFIPNDVNDPQYSQLNLTGIEEEEIYLSPYISQQSSSNLEVLNADFNDPTPLPADPDTAYYLVNLQNLVPNQLYTVGVTCTDI